MCYKFIKILGVLWMGVLISYYIAVKLAYQGCVH